MQSLRLTVSGSKVHDVKNLIPISTCCYFSPIALAHPLIGHTPRAQKNGPPPLRFFPRAPAPAHSDVAVPHARWPTPPAAPLDVRTSLPAGDAPAGLVARGRCGGRGRPVEKAEKRHGPLRGGQPLRGRHPPRQNGPGATRTTPLIRKIRFEMQKHLSPVGVSSRDCWCVVTVRETFLVPLSVSDLMNPRI